MTEGDKGHLKKRSGLIFRTDHWERQVKIHANLEQDMRMLKKGKSPSNKGVKRLKRTEVLQEKPREEPTPNEEPSPREEHSPKEKPSFSRQRVTLASMLEEARGDPKVANITKEKSAQRGPISSTGPVNPSLIKKDLEITQPKKEEMAGLLKEESTAISLCKKKHIRLACDWSFADPINRRKEWRIRLIDYRQDPDVFTNGMEEHKYCIRATTSALLNGLASRIHQDMKEIQHYLPNAYDANTQQWSRSAAKMQIPPIRRIEQELHPLIVNVLREINRDDNKGSTEESIDNKKTEKDVKRIAADKRERMKREAESSRLAKLMKDQAERKEDDQRRVKDATLRQVEAQRSVNEAGLVAVQHAKQQSRRESTVSKMTREEQKAFRSIHAAEQEEVDQLDQAEARAKRQLADQKREAGPAVEQDEDADDGLEAALPEALEEDTDDGLEAAMLEALEEDISKPKSVIKQPAKKPQKKTNALRSPKATISGEKPDISTPPVEERKRRRQRARPIIQDSSDDSDSVKERKPGRQIRPEVTFRIPRISFADYLVAKAASRGSASKSEQLNTQVTKPATAEYSKNVVKGKDEATAITVQVEQRNDTTDRTEVTRTTTVKSDSDQGETAVKHASRVQSSTTTEVSKQESAHDTAPKHEPENGSGASSNAQGAAVDTSSPRSTPSTPFNPDTSSSGKRKRTGIDLEPSDNLSSSKKRKVESPIASATVQQPDEGASANTDSPPAHQTRSKTSEHASSGEKSTDLSATSTSSQKRKMTWSEDDGQVSISSGGTKRVKRVHFSNQAESNVDAETPQVEAGSKDSLDSLFEDELDV
ncbi:hypothetical protein OPT61_g726 [Boeremia exigua]|uniref:Uncharacterized protein n=1 Tax=Boeremia exigua TaxID=749465 RepID=A0ACC2ISX0_9PLEO|nr:hypothetical protein OPT61_g726 [Boeremia exigua]